jgi:hypothetical protein
MAEMDPAHMLTGFPAPWTVCEAAGEFVVMDASGRTLAHFYWWGDGIPAFLTRDEARCLAEKFAKTPSVMAQRRKGWHGKEASATR